jgi:hypothetical protein
MQQQLTWVIKQVQILIGTIDTEFKPRKHLIEYLEKVADDSLSWSLNAVKRGVARPNKRLSEDCGLLGCHA